MAWNGTVTCSYCYAGGHNRRGCPKLKEYIKENPDSYEANRAEVRKRTYSTRACSYCKEPGHTRRTCGHMKRHKAEWVDHNRRWCGLVNEMLRERGIGVGTLVKKIESVWNETEARYIKEPVLSIIKGFDLTAMNFECSIDPSASYALRLYPVKETMDPNRNMRLALLPYHPVLNRLTSFYRERSEKAIVGPVECNKANPYGSAHYYEWLRGSLNVDAIFKERNLWNYPNEGYNDYCDLRNIENSC